MEAGAGMTKPLVFGAVFEMKEKTWW